MVDCYCGCDTRANRFKFAASGTVYFLGLTILLFSTAYISNTCFNRTAIGRRPWNKETGGITTQRHSTITCTTECQILQTNMDVEDMHKYHCEEAIGQKFECMNSQEHITYVFMILVGEFLIVLATVPLCVLCCCTKKPPSEELINAPTAVHMGDVYDRMNLGF